MRGEMIVRTVRLLDGPPRIELPNAAALRKKAREAENQRKLQTRYTQRIMRKEAEIKDLDRRIFKLQQEIAELRLLVSSHTPAGESAAEGRFETSAVGAG